jgi:hypothetical protein
MADHLSCTKTSHADLEHELTSDFSRTDLDSGFGDTREGAAAS